MWSYVQYRRMGKQIEEEMRRKSQCINNHDSLPMKDLSSIEHGIASVPNGRSKSRLKGSGSSKEGEKRNSQNEAANTSDTHKVVGTSGEDDPFDPHNWPLLSRCKNIAILSILVFVQAWAGAAESMANAAASEEFGISQVAENLSTAMYLFGISSGSLFVGSFSETVGRNPTYLVATFFYLFFVLGSALTPTFGGQIVCRYFIGLFASATLAINGSSVRDQFRPVRRAFVFPVLAWANVASPYIAPIAGGYIVSNSKLGWRWTEWITLIISGAAYLIALLFLPETYLPILLDWKAKHLRRLTGDSRYVSEHSQSASFMKKTKQVLVLPAKFLGTEPVIAILGAYLVLLYTLLFSSLSGFDYIFKQTYQLSTAHTGACFAAVVAGSTAFTICVPGLYSLARKKTESVHGRPVTPEFRLWPAILGAPLLPISLLWLGWTNYQSVSIWCGLGACFIFGFVLIAIYVSSYEYIIDSYGDHSAIALASITMVRYLVAGGMVMAARPMYKGIGVHWTLTIMGSIAVILAPAPLLFWRYGAKLREKSSYAKGDNDGDRDNTK